MMPVKLKVGKAVPITDNRTHTVHAKFVDCRDTLNNCLIERKEEVDLLLTGLVARTNPLFVGPPGTAKSSLVDGLLKWLSGGVGFDYLLTKFTDPSELFGPVDLPSLKAGRYERLVGGYLPTAHLAFLDEIFKASSAILNTMLKVLNERTFRFGQQSIKTPLLMIVAASNEWPDSESGKELSALFDRFLIRKTVAPVSKKAGRQALLKLAVNGGSVSPSYKTSITPQEIEQASNESGKLPFSDSAKKVLWSLVGDKGSLNDVGIIPSDRRLVKSISVCRASAWLEGASEVLPRHLMVLSHVLWDSPEDAEKCRRLVVKAADSILYEIEDLLMQAGDVVEKAARPEEVVAKLQAIQKQLGHLPDDPRRDEAVKEVAGQIKEAYNKVIGVEE